MCEISTVKTLLLVNNKKKLSIKKTILNIGLSTRKVYQWSKNNKSKQASMLNQKIKYGEIKERL